jgi:O-antigen/teichoic acid export membrane protein
MGALSPVTRAFAAVRALLKRWGARSVASVLDQGLFSGSNFLLSLFLARWLAPGEYGVFAVAFSIFLFAAGFHNALILDPMYVLGSARHDSDPRGYLGTLLWLHAGLAVVMSAVLAGAAGVLWAFHSTLAGSILSLAAGSPFILLFWLFRSACYLQTRPDLALMGSAAYGILLLGGALLVFRGRHGAPAAVFLCMAAAGLGGAVLLFRALGMRRRDLSWSAARPRVRETASENWRYGRWVTGSAVIYWLSGALYLPLVGSFAGLEQAGAWQALQNLLRPMQQGVTAMSTLFLPHVARQRAAQSGDRGHGTPWHSPFRRTVGVIVAAIAAFSVAYLLLLLAAQGWIVRFFYRRSYYGEFAGLLPLLWLAAFLGVMTQGLVIGLKSVQRSDLLFWAQALGAVATVTVGLAFVSSMKIQGAAIGTAISGLILAAGHLVVFLPWLRGRR